MKYLKVFSIAIIAFLSFVQTTFAQTKPTAATPKAVQTPSKAQQPKTAAAAEQPKTATAGKKTAKMKQSKADKTAKATKKEEGGAPTATPNRKGRKKQTNKASKSSDANAPAQHALIGSLPNKAPQPKAEKTPQTKAQGVSTAPAKTNNKGLNKSSSNNAPIISDKDQMIGHDAKGRQMYRGPRGGEYYLNSSGSKTYTKPEKQ
jgi:colicin import membrane protein